VGCNWFPCILTFNNELSFRFGHGLGLVALQLTGARAVGCGLVAGEAEIALGREPRPTALQFLAGGPQGTTERSTIRAPHGPARALHFSAISPARYEALLRFLPRKKVRLSGNPYHDLAASMPRITFDLSDKSGALMAKSIECGVGEVTVRFVARNPAG
jgi:hypothetical protein